jgi:hypothetical protein
MQSAVKSFLAFCALLALMVVGHAETTPPVQEPFQQPVQSPQGIHGTVTFVEGNFMPGVEPETNPKKSAHKLTNGTALPVERDIVIYNLTNIKDATVTGDHDFYSAVVGKPVATVTSDPNGNFFAALPPGQYSVFTVEDGGLYANRFDDSDNINPVEVKENATTDIQIKIDYLATN